jgi:hypothetical protein
MVIISKAQTDGQNQPLEGQDGLQDNDVDEPPLPEPGLPGFRSQSNIEVKDLTGDIKSVGTSNSSIVGEVINVATWDGNANLAHLYHSDEIASFLKVDVK